jgi:hypothetical protein
MGQLRYILFYGLILLGFSRSSSAATFTYLSQQRFVTASNLLIPATDEHDAPDFVPFNATASETGVEATQESTLGADEIDAIGDADVVGATAPGQGQSESFLDVQFTLSHSILFQITGNAQSDTPNSGLEMRISDPLGGQYLPAEGFNGNLLLFKGQYDLHIDATATTSLATYQFHMTAVSPPIVPLPPAFWAGLATLGLIGFVGLARSRGRAVNL